MGLYSATGTLLGSTADQSAAWVTGGGTSTGQKKVPLTTPYVNAPIGFYYVGILTNGTTTPAFIRNANTNGVNFNLTAGNYRWALYGSSQTTLPASVPMASAPLSSLTIWVGVN